MAEKQGFFANGGNDREYTDDLLCAPFGAISGKAGICEFVGDKMKPEIGTGLQIVVNSGFAFLGDLPGWWYQLTASTIVEIDPEAAGFKRVDAIILKMDRNTGVRLTSLIAKKGTPTTGTPSAPTLQQDATIFEMLIAHVVVDESTIESMEDKRNFANLSTGYINDSSIAEGMCAKKKSDGTWEVSEYGYALSDGNKLVLPGNICKVNGLQWPYRYFVQSDGSIGLNVTDKTAGVSISDHELIVLMQGACGVPQAYAEDMQEYFAMPGPSGKIWVKSKMPQAADKVEIYYKLSVWAVEDTVEDDGTLIATYTEDDDYYGLNNWLEITVSGQSDGTKLYTKAVPSVAGVRNQSFGSNESVTELGILAMQHTGDNVASDTSTDDAGSNHGTLVSGIADMGKVGDAFIFSTGYMIISDESVNDGALSFSLKISDGVETGVFGHSDRKHPEGLVQSNVLKVGGRNGGGTTHIYAEYTLVPSQWYNVVVKFSATEVKLYVNNVLRDTATVSIETLTINRIGRCNVGNSGDNHKDGKCEMDQARRLGNIGTGTISTLHNGGLAC